MSRRKILVADLLCGAGGSSTGCERALRELGLDMELVCVNHWNVAIDTHKLNHPQARHYVQDIATVRPHILVPEGYLDLLMASPTCTHHSVARGGKPTSDQQRSDPWHIITWLTELRVKRIIIENVWEFIGWGPVDPKTGKPIKSRKGEYFQAWIATLQRLGFQPEWRKLNAADYGDATTRQRFILMARSDGRRVAWPTPTHMKRPEDEGLALFPTMKPWRPAREIIDWNLKGRSIFNRKKPLAAKTILRIYAGIVKFNWPEPYLVRLRNHMADRGIPIPNAAGNNLHIATAEPFVMSAAHGVGADETNPHDRRVKSIDDPLGAIHAGGGNFGLVEPFVLSQGAGGIPRSVDNPVPTIPTDGGHALIAPYYGSGSGETCTSDAEPLPTLTTKARLGIVVPVTHSKSGNAARTVDDPIPTMTTAKGGEFAVVMPGRHDASRAELAFIAAQFGEREGQAPRVHDIAEPTPTISATGHINLVEPSADDLYDILFRMFEPPELGAAMGFSDEEQSYEFAGTKTDQIKQIGNAVSVKKMKACVGAIMADAVPRQRTQPAKQEQTVKEAA